MTRGSHWVIRVTAAAIVLVPSIVSKVLVKGKGANLGVEMPAYDLPLLVQLSNSSNDACWSATFDAADVIRNQSGAFKARFKAP